MGAQAVGRELGPRRGDARGVAEELPNRRGLARLEPRVSDAGVELEPLGRGHAVPLLPALEGPRRVHGAPLAGVEEDAPPPRAPGRERPGRVADHGGGKVPRRDVQTAAEGLQAPSGLERHQVVDDEGPREELADVDADERGEAGEVGREHPARAREARPDAVRAPAGALRAGGPAHAAASAMPDGRILYFVAALDCTMNTSHAIGAVASPSPHGIIDSSGSIVKV